MRRCGVVKERERFKVLHLERERERERERGERKVVFTVRDDW